MATIEQQIKLITRINNAYTNFKKLGNANMTKGACMARIALMQKYWEEFEKGHRELEKSDDVDLDDPYFKDDHFTVAQELYLNNSGLFQDFLLNVKEQEEREERRSGMGEITANMDYTRAKLPPLELELFSGNIQEWVRFRDTFTEMIINRPNLPNIYKMNYLRKCISGDAAELLDEVPSGGENFTEAWKVLTSYYDNKRLLINKLLSKLLSVQAMNADTASELSRVLNHVKNVLQALKALGSPVDHWDHITVFLLTSKLTTRCQTKWEDVLVQSDDPTAPVTFQALCKYLEAERNALSLIESTQEYKTRDSASKKTESFKHNKGGNSSKKEKKSANFNQTTKVECPCCNGQHSVYKCNSFLSKTPTERKQIISQRHLCFNCFGQHTVKDCKSTKGCFVCQGKHHTSLHIDGGVKNNAPKIVNDSSTPSNSKDSLHSQSTSASCLTTVLKVASTQVNALLATARIRACSDNGRQVTVRALVDQCAQSSFVTEELCQRLRLNKHKVNLPITGIGKREINVQSEVEVMIRPHFASSFACTFNAYVLPKITAYEPSFVTAEGWDHVRNLQLADPEYSKPGRIDVLLGTKVHALIIQEGLRKGTQSMPIAMKSTLGWILSGTILGSNTRNSTPTVHLQVDSQLDERLRTFWEIEEIPRVKLWSPEDKQCEEHYVQNTIRLENGAYQVRLPIRDKVPKDWKNSRQIALNCLLSLERRLSKKQDLGKEYHESIRKMIKAGHIKKIEIAPDEVSKHYFLPHHAVVKESSNTTRVRPVFNASARNLEGQSLNDILLTGPSLLPDLVRTLMRWRFYRYAFVADISKMYLFVALDPRDWPLQTILWRESATQPVETYALTTVMFGCCSSPFLASRTLRQLAVDEGANYPEAASIIRDETYMDDILTGSYDLKSAQTKQQQLRQLLASGQFQLAKWMANDRKLLSNLVPDLIATEATLKVGLGFSILGLVWDPGADAFKFNACLPPVRYPVTKRSVLSAIAGMFDPCGWIAPIIIPLKTFMQSLWLLTKEWDEPLPAKEVKQWESYHDDMGELKTIVLPRWIDFNPNVAMELHGFADASKFAYAAVLYIRLFLGEFVSVQLLVSKTKVAPIKTLSIPRLELCAAHLLAKLVNSVVDMEMFSNTPVHLWSDSRNTLYWIHGLPAKWPTFVANRCADINTLVPNAHWHYVHTKQNPADLASRGCSVKELRDNSLWWHGPPMLIESNKAWPKASAKDVSIEENTDMTVLCQTTDDKVTTKSWSLLDEHSSLSRAINVTAYVLRFLRKITEKHHDKLLRKYPDSDTTHINNLEWKQTLLFLCAETQRKYYSAELELLAKGKELLKGHNLRALSPVYKDGLIRVGGRLKNAQLSEDEKFPIILPSNSQLVKLLIDYYHSLTMHGGVQMIVAQIRKTFWIPRIKEKVKSHVNHCVTCKRYKATQVHQKMADLPAARVQISRPFSRVGIDYAGPIQLKMSKHRGYKSYKGYLVVFVCMATKAAHLEAVSGYDTASFLAAYRRFIARRGPCFDIYSDQGTNFIGADSELRKLFAQNSETYSEIAKITKTKWHFNPPGAPHFGGLWESCVRAVKFHLKRCIGETILTFEEFYTLFTQIEALLNSRPITPLQDDSTDDLALTPAHFLIGESSLIMAEPLVSDDNISPLDRWKRVTQLTHSFWVRWSREYLQALQKRSKWLIPQENVQIGDIVLIKNENLPPSQWPLARVLEVHPGSDQLVRVVTLKTAIYVSSRMIEAASG